MDLRLVLFFFVSFAPALAVSTPYQFTAVYTQGTQLKEVAITQGLILPDNADGLRLTSIRVDFNREGLGAATIGSYRNFSVGLKVGNAPMRTESVEVDKISPTFQQLLIPWSDNLEPSARTVQINADVRGKFTSDFLCAHELLYRREKGQARTSTVPAGLYVAAGDVPDKELRQKSVELLYSFCAPDSVNWDVALTTKANLFGKNITSGEKLKEEHKTRLARLLISDGALRRFSLPYAEIRIEADADGYPSNVFVESSITFSIVRTSDLVRIRERSSSTPLESGQIIGMDSTLIVRSGTPEAGTCPAIFASPFQLQVKDLSEGERKLVPESPKDEFRHTCERELTINLKEYLGRKISINTVYIFPDKSEATVAHVTFEVADLGIVTTFPIVSELVSAAKGSTPQALESTSSVPISYAMSLDGRSKATFAITFPWKIGLNTREYPNAAKILMVFPHVSLLGGETSAAPRIALGVGFSLLQIFHFAYAVHPVNDGRAAHFLLAGVGVQDVAKLLLQH